MVHKAGCAVARTAADLIGLPVAALAGYRNKARRLIRVVPVKLVFKGWRRPAPVDHPLEHGSLPL